MGGTRRRGEGKAAQGGKQLQALGGYVLLHVDGGASNLVPNTPPFFCAPITGDDSPQTRELNVEDGVGFRAERAKDVGGGDVRGDLLRQDRDKRGIGIDDGRKWAVFGGIRAGRACGRAAARHGDRGGQPFRTARRLVLRSLGEGGGRLRRSAGLRPEPPSASGGFRLRPGPCGANTTADKRNSLQRLRADICGIFSIQFDPSPPLR